MDGQSRRLVIGQYGLELARGEVGRDLVGQQARDAEALRRGDDCRTERAGQAWYVALFMQ